MTIRTNAPTCSAAGALSRRDYARLRPGPGQSRMDVVASQRARMRRAVIELAARGGLDAVTVRRLTRLAGVSPRAFYAQFSGIGECVLATYGEVMGAISSHIVATRSAMLGPVEQADRVCRVLLGDLLGDADIARFALIEIYAGGPAALSMIALEERRLEAALRGCLNRRSQPVEKDVPLAILAAAMHWARERLMGAAWDEEETSIDAFVEWARDVADGVEEVDVAVLEGPKSRFAGLAWDDCARQAGDRDERDLIVTAVLRLAAPEGYSGLTPTKVSSTAGLPTACVRRHFRDLADGYLAAIRRTFKALFIELTSPTDSPATSGVSVHAALQRALYRAASNPSAALLIFRQIVEPGVSGLTCRETLISELATAYRAAMPSANRPTRMRAEARVAALWGSLAPPSNSLRGTLLQAHSGV